MSYACKIAEKYILKEIYMIVLFRREYTVFGEVVWIGVLIVIGQFSYQPIDISLFMMVEGMNE